MQQRALMFFLAVIIRSEHVAPAVRTIQIAQQTPWSVGGDAIQDLQDS